MYLLFGEILHSCVTIGQARENPVRVKSEAIAKESNDSLQQHGTELELSLDG